MVDELRPSLSAFEALDAAGAEVFFVLTGSFWERADPAADLLLAPVLPLLSVFEAAVAALDDVVFPDMIPSIHNQRAMRQLVADLFLYPSRTSSHADYA